MLKIFVSLTTAGEPSSGQFSGCSDYKFSLGMICSRRERTICLLDLPSSIIHRDEPEAKKQLEREAALEQQRRRQVVTTEETEEAKTEEIDLRKKVILSLHFFLLLIKSFTAKKIKKAGKRRTGKIKK